MRNSLNRRFESDFDRHESRIFGAIISIWVVGALVSLICIGVGIWAVITIVNHFAG